MLFVNVWNIVIGVLCMKDFKEVAWCGLEVFIYMFGFVIGENGESVLSNFNFYKESLDMLYQLGFKVLVEGDE